MSGWRDPAAIWLHAARVTAWALLLSGWVGVTTLAMQFTAGPFGAMAVVALWLLALGAISVGVPRMSLSSTAVRGIVIVCGVVAALAMHEAVHGAGLSALIAALIAWAAIVALASTTVRARRGLMPSRPPAPRVDAAAGAVLAACVLADPGDVSALGLRLGLFAVAASLVLAGLQPGGQRSSPTSGCRAGLFDCSLPAWPVAGRRSLRHWPVWLSLVVMLPMMCSLPWMISLCQSESVSARAVIGLHFGAMFVPALLFGRRPGVAAVCAPLLVLGAAAAAWLEWAPGQVATAAWLLVVAHGAAWSLAWATQLSEGAGRAGGWCAGARASPARAAVMQAGLALVLGGLLAWVGPRGFVLWHLALGAAALVAWVGVNRFWRVAAVPD